MKTERWPRRFKVRRITTRGSAVYIIGCPSTGRYKVGITKNTRQRLSVMQVGSPTELKLMAQTYIDPDGINPAKLEKALHARLKPWRSHGEWFETTRQRMILAWHQVAGELWEKDKLSHQETPVAQAIAY